MNEMPKSKKHPSWILTYVGHNSDNDVLDAIEAQESAASGVRRFRSLDRAKSALWRTFKAEMDDELESSELDPVEDAEMLEEHEEKMAEARRQLDAWDGTDVLRLFQYDDYDGAWGFSLVRA